jgi:hypothetical protein
VQALAALVQVLGLLTAVMMTRQPPPPVRAGGFGNLEAMTGARQPDWVGFVNPLVGVAGVLAGGRLRRGRARA